MRGLRRCPSHIKRKTPFHYRNLFSSVQHFGVTALILANWNLVFEIWPTSSFLTPPPAVAMSEIHPELMAVHRDGHESLHVGFRAGLTSIFHQCIELIFPIRASSTSSRHAACKLSPSKRRSRAVSFADEENYIARQVREIYCKLLTTPIPLILTHNHQCLIFQPLLRCLVANSLPKPFAVREYAKNIRWFCLFP